VPHAVKLLTCAACPGPLAPLV